MLEKRIDNNPFPTPNKTELEGQVKSGKSVLDGPSIRPLGSYSEYKNRIASYIRWPNTHISPETLAKAGFYCIGYNDVVRCAFCGIEGHNWEEGDNPMADHRKWNPSCSFVQRSEHDNTVAVLNSDTCGKYGIEIFPNSVPEEDELKQLEKLGIAKTKGPANPEYRAIETRIISFDTWPKCMKQRPAELAEAGFYYTGVGDQTLCFHCGGGLKNWEENDDPWEQHAMWFSKCNYLMLKKGIEYIEQIKRKNQAIVQEASGSAASSASHVETKEEASSALGAVVKAAEITSSEEVKTEEKTLCKICYKNELGVVFLPCGHIVACVDCASALKICAVCRKPLEATVRAFLS